MIKEHKFYLVFKAETPDHASAADHAATAIRPIEPSKAWREQFHRIIAALLGPAMTEATAQSYPTKPVRMIVPFAPGGSTDIVSRLMAERMTTVLGQTVQVENRPGANTIIGAEYVARARPDGHTLLMAAGTTLTINPVIVQTTIVSIKTSIAPQSPWRPG